MRCPAAGEHAVELQVIGTGFGRTEFQLVASS
jgi:hypothetical protein